MTRRVTWLSVGSLGAITVFAVIAPLLAPYDATLPIGIPLAAPFGDTGLFGTDQVGRDILSRVLEGMSASWLASAGLVLPIASFGSLVGVVAGYLGGWADRALMAVVDFFLALPAAILAVVIAAVLGPSLRNALIAIGVLSWPYYARLVRAEIRAIASRPHIEAAKLAGNGHLRLVLRHLLPGAWPVILVTVTLDLGGVITMLAGLSFLGLGRPEPAPELGSMAAQGLPYLLTHWWIPVIPAVAVTCLALIANLAGDALRSQMKAQ
ncbi:cytochrome c550 [Acrocarpospora phusangensis]|uniref:Cytochrome c550 n=1 Tax=Acrocarpospora phusangensis TaxID=1070424 RepID=A0A919Q902_9ACTN|nr:ABC transporter permease [Acrocarpospora phusangensis]GIH23409.1 cytochrome c550 [Acrocarpospora phusangensis]